MCVLLLDDETIINGIKNLFGRGTHKMMLPSKLPRSRDRPIHEHPTRETMETAKLVFGEYYNTWVMSVGRKTNHDVWKDIDEQMRKKEGVALQDTINRLSVNEVYDNSYWITRMANQEMRNDPNYEPSADPTMPKGWKAD